MANTPCRILFIPVSGPAGAGEYYRCLNLAQQLAEQPGAPEIHFCLSRESAAARPEPFIFHEISDSPTRCSNEVLPLIRQLAPQLVVFDSTLRTVQIRAAAKSGAGVLYISSRSNRRRKGFALHKLRHLDAHWVLTPPGDQALSRWEQWKCKRTGTRVRFFSALMATPDPRRREAFLADKGRVEKQGYCLFVSGGGGGTINGEATARVFQDAARAFRRQSGLPTLFIAGPLARIGLREDQGVLELDSVPGNILSDLIAGARLVVSGGGSIVQQTLALQTPCLAIPAGGKDQPERIARLVGEGVIATTEAKASSSEPALALARDAAELAADERRCQALVSTASQQGYSNGSEQATQALMAWLQSPEDPA